MFERPKHRLNFVAMVLVALCLLVLGKLVLIQVFSYEELLETGDHERFRQSALAPMRGRVWDRNGHLLAGNLVHYKISASPRLLGNPAGAAEALASDLDLDFDEVYEKLRSDDTWVLLKHSVPQDVGDKILKREIFGIHAEPVWIRTYPEGMLAAHVLGFVNAEDKGFYGIEGYYDTELRGQPGKRIYQQDAQSQAIPLGLADYEPPQPGVDLVLSLDRTVQALVEEGLAQALDETGAERGVIIVMDPRTGAILAMAAAPAYDPNQFWSVLDTRQFINPAVNSHYEPGSVFKVLTVAVALENGLVSPETMFYDEGWIEVGGQVVQNANRQAYGYVTLTEALVHSLNVEMARVSTLLGTEVFYKGLRAFGIGHSTGVDLDGEVSGELRVPGDWRWHESDLATNAFGQGLAVTPLQMITAVAAIANDGIMVKPFIVAEKRYADGQIERVQPVPIDWVVSPETARLVAEMMAQTIEYGTEEAKVPNYRIAGKTGTAQMPTPFGYDETKTIASFVGFAPVDDPQVIVLVRLDEPTSSPWGSHTAAPAFSRLARRLFVLLEIPPDHVRLGMAGW